MANIGRSALDTDNEACVATVDMRNAFNSINREAVLSAVINTPLSDLAKWACAIPQLRFGKAALQCSIGVQQGDPAVPMLFAFALDAALRESRAKFPEDIFDVWYADDGYIVGPQKSLLIAYDFLDKPILRIGLYLNRNKCAVWLRQGTVTDLIPDVNTYTISKSQSPLTVF